MALAAASALALTAWPSPPARADEAADNLLIVDCLLPGRIQRLGNAATYATARKAVQTSAADCRRRGGEYTESNGQTYANLMRIWMPLAKAGDVEAQTNLGEIFEKGLGGPPQPDLAVQWYQLAADKGSARAQVNLGSLYERGFGVARNSQKAMELYRRATGLAGLPVATTAATSNEEVNRLRQERDTLSQQLQSERRQRESLEAELNAIRKRLSGERGALQQQQLDLDAARRELAARSQAVEQQRAARPVTTTSTPDTQSARRLAELQRQYDDQAKLVAARDTQLKTLQASVKQLEGQSSTLQGQLASAEQRRQSDVIAARGETEAVRQQLSTATAELRRANDDLSARIATIDQQRAEVAGLKRQLASAGTSGGQQKALEATLRKRESELAESQRKLIDISAVLERLQNDSVSTARTPSGNIAAKPYRTPAGVQFGRYHALVIGNNNYKFGPKLRTAVADARSVADVLKRRYGFDTMVLIDANRYQILSALNTMREKLTAEDNLLIYFAGHGELDVANDRGYWLPVDAETNSSANWIPSYQVTDILRASTAKQIMIVADSCFSGTLTRSAVGKLSAGLTDDEKIRFYKAMTERRTRVALTSGGDQPVLDSGGGAHSVFAASFLQTLESNSEVLEAQKLAQRVIQRVAISPDAAKIAQVPIYAPLSFAGHEAGDFFFVPTS